MKNLFKSKLTLLFITFLAAVGIISCGGEPDPRLEELRSDMDQMKRNVSESDTITMAIKNILNIASMDGFDVDNFEYFTEIKEDKAIALVRIPEIKDVVKEDRGVFMDLVDELTNEGAWEGKEKYIGIFGKLRVRMTKNPKERKDKLTTRLALLDYYGPPPVEE